MGTVTELPVAPTSTAFEMKFHPIADVFPLLEGAAFETLVADIAAHGLREPILLHPDGRILDGRNRYRACLQAEAELGRDPGEIVRYETWRGDPGTELDFVLSKNLHRRHLNETERAMVADRIAKLPHGSNQWTGRSAGPPTQAEAAKTMKVSERTVRKARSVREWGVPELVAAVDRGEIKLDLADKITAASHPQQRAALRKGPEALRELAEQLQRKRAASTTTKKKTSKSKSKAKPATSALDAAEAEDDAIEVLLDPDDTPETQERDRLFQLLTKRLDVVMGMLKLSPDPIWHKVVKERLQLCVWLIEKGNFDHGDLPESTNAPKPASQDRAAATIATEVAPEVGGKTPLTAIKRAAAPR